ncbi:hypothetical protein GGR52DRAFT_583273 [Hypoxylon sp. FL1284]|nr:hypothetical protein GGR52DRAFT_583273 [Hypoxylon sp. FL1284]
MRHLLRIGGAVLCLSLTRALASPIIARQEDCVALSPTPKWTITDAMSSDWAASGGGRVQLFAQHEPTGELVSCDVEYSMNATDGTIIDYDPEAVHPCVSFGTSGFYTTVMLDMDTLELNIYSAWNCTGFENETYLGTGSTMLQRDTSPEACLVEPNQTGEAVTCPIADAVIEGELMGIVSCCDTSTRPVHL